jgi:hypothetical protein
MAGDRRIKIIQGEYRVSDEQDTVITTLLGSRVAACLHDTVARVGGMNHFLLSGGEPGSSTAARYGVHLMELLVNGLLKTYGPPRLQVIFVIRPEQSAKTYPAFQLRRWPRWRFAHPDPHKGDGVERHF